ncbi:MAG: MFS transporter [Acidimicrobiales bacterium]
MVLAFAARFTDEVLYGAVDVLLPTFRRVFGLSLVQLGFLAQVLEWVALAIEPPTAALVDLRSRRRLMSFGALAMAAAMLTAAGATGYGVLLAAFALYGLGSGPLVNTADVVVVESFPADPERAYSRATFADTVGALLGPAAIALTTAAGVSWRVTLGVLGGGALAYAVVLAKTRMPGPPGVHDREGGRGLRGRNAAVVANVVANIRDVLRDRSARRALTVLLCFDVFEAAFVLKYVWLNESVGLSEPWVAAYAAAEQAVSLVALVALDRWLARRDAGHLLRVAAAALVVLPVAWVAAPGVAGTIAVGIPLAVAHTFVWPLAKARALTAVPSLAGATQAVTTLFPIIPLALLEAGLAAASGIGTAMAATAAFGAMLMVLAIPRAAPRARAERGA